MFGAHNYFKRIVPHLAQCSPVLKYATVALAAKHLSRLNGIWIPNVTSRLAMTEYYPEADLSDWSYKAADYYYQAVTHFQDDLKHAENLELLGSSGQDLHTPKDKLNAPQAQTTKGLESLLSASAVLLIYDALDNSMTELFG